MWKVFVFLTAVALCCESDIPADPLSAPVVIVFPVLPSGCRSFQSLTEALQVPASPVLRIHIRPTTAGVQLTGDIAITGQVEVYANNTLLEVSGTVTIQGSVTIVEADFTIAGHKDSPVFIVAGTLALQKGKVAGGNRKLIQVLAGRVTISQSQLQGLENSILDLQSANFQLLMDQLSITNCSSLIEVNFRATRYEGYAQLTDIIMRNSSRLLWCGNCELGSLQLHIHDSMFFDACRDLISGAVENLQIYMENVTFQGIDNIVNGSLYNSTLDMRNSTVRQLQKLFISLSALSGEINIESTEFTEVQGPIVLLPANPYSPQVAMVSFHHCSISALQNPQGSAALFCCGSATLVAASIEVRDSHISNSGLFQMTSGIVHLSQVNYHDCSGLFATIYQVQATELQLLDSALSRLTLNGGFFSSCIASSYCLWLNVSITDVLDFSQNAALIYTWGGFLGTAVVQRCYFRPSQVQSILSLGAAVHGSLLLSDSVFEDLWNFETFGAYTESFVSVTNLTLIRPRLEVLLTAEFQANISVSGVTVLGEARFKTLIQANSGGAVLTNAEFTGITDAAVKATDAYLELANVTIRDIDAVMCRNCENAVFIMDSFTLEKVRAPIVFQVFFSSLAWRNVTMRGIHCQQLLVLNYAELVVASGVFEEMELDSSGGLIDSTSSTVTIDSSKFHLLQSAVSLYLGLIFLETSSLEVRSSSFSDFNCTLIHSIKSTSVQLSDSLFFTSDSQALQYSQSLKLRGRVLWSEQTPAVTVTNCRFANLTAHDGGVLYLAGSREDICNIDNSVAELNTAKRTGGFMYSDGVRVTIRKCGFMNNSAVEGGALALFGSSHSTVAHSFFANNRAYRAGGAITNRKNNTDFVFCEWSNNNALYGPNIASEVTSLAVLEKNSFRIIPNYSFDAVSGQAYQTEIVIGCIDYFNEIVLTDSGSKLALFALEANSSVIVSNLLESSSGVYRIPSLTVIGEPGSTLSIYGTHGTNLTVLLLTVRLRECVAGEYQSALQCKPCSHNTYSFSPLQPCTLCPDQADCPGGPLMSLHRGYWRLHNATDDIIECIIPSLCTGGVNSDCATGHTGVMCSSCASGFFKSSQLQCQPCHGLLTSALRSTLSIAVSAASIALSSLKGSVLTAIVVLDYFQSIWVLSHCSVFWPDAAAVVAEAAGDLGSLGLAFSTTSCYGDDRKYWVLRSQFVAMVVHAGVAVAALLGLGAVLLYSAQKLTRKRFFRLLFYAYFLMLPVAVHRSLQLLPYFDISGTQYLILDSSVESWTEPHMATALTANAVLGACAIATVCCLHLAARSRRGKRAISQWKAKLLCVLLLRKLLLSPIAVFSNSLALCTQVALAITVHIAAEAGMTSIRQQQLPLRLFQCCVTTSVAHCFAIAMFSAAHVRSELPFLLSYFALFISPLLFLWMSQHSTVRASGATIVPIAQDTQTAVDVQGVTLEERPVLSDSSEVVQPPHPSPQLENWQ